VNSTIGKSYMRKYRRIVMHRTLRLARTATTPPLIRNAGARHGKPFCRRRLGIPDHTKCSTNLTVMMLGERVAGWLKSAR
jgi:hypothetical protein